MKKSLILPIAFAAIFVLAAAHRSQAQLIVQNPGFNDLTGLSTDIPGLWYGGIPAGWAGNDSAFTVREFDPVSPTGNYVANLNTLSKTTPDFIALRQAVGTLDAAGIITLSINVIDLSPPPGGFTMSMGIFDTKNSSNYADWTALALPPASIATTGFHTLSTSVSIDAGTPIGIGLWADNGAPGIDNVSVVPEPSTYALLGLGAAGLGAHLVRRRRR